MMKELRGDEIAVIGMAGRYPSCDNLHDFWRLLAEGREGIRRFSAEEMLADGVDPALVRHPDFQGVHAALDGAERFDYGFFGYSPREAEVMDPQHRHFMEVSWLALEDAGYDPRRYDGQIGVFAGASAPYYLIHNIRANPEVLASVGDFQAGLGNLSDFLTTNVAYKLDLRGPAVTVATSCSTSLVAVVMACSQLLAGNCDMALVGGVSIRIPQRRGYVYQEGHILSPDGHCRPFDAAAAGTVAGDGVGVVVLKLLEDALADGDHIEAVILGAASNNDGDAKVGYTAPGHAGQVAVIRSAHQAAEITADTIDYVECHGTGTPLGDPIEVGALTDAFRASSTQASCCRIGSVKSNIGHLDSAAGITGFIKTVLALRHRQIPPTLHLSEPNPHIDFANSPFQVAHRLEDWPEHAHPPRAGVSSYGIGGTNAHVVLEAAPAPIASTPSQRPDVLVLSARSREQVQEQAEALADSLDAQPELALADVAFTLQEGRARFEHGLSLAVRHRDEAVALLRDGSKTVDAVPKCAVQALPAGVKRVFLCSGQGSQYPGMAGAAHRELASFRSAFDDAWNACAEWLDPADAANLRQLLLEAERRDADATAQLENTAFTQPALFMLSIAWAAQWQAWGLHADGYLGHSIGEYAAAYLAGVFELRDAARLVVARGRVLQTQPRGAMLSVQVPPARAAELCESELDLAAINAPEACVLAGPEPAIAACTERCERLGIGAVRLHTSHAFHSRMMQGALAEFRRELEQIRFHAPREPVWSAVRGGLADHRDICSVDYWLDNIRQPVRFADAIGALAESPAVLGIEIGPGRQLCSLARATAGGTTRCWLATMPGPHSDCDAVQHAAAIAGALSIVDTRSALSGLRSGSAHRVSLPGYPFAGRALWVAPSSDAPSTGQPELRRQAELSDWFAVPRWQEQPLPLHAIPDQGSQTLILHASGTWSAWLAAQWPAALSCHWQDHAALEKALEGGATRLIHAVLADRPELTGEQLEDAALLLPRRIAQLLEQRGEAAELVLLSRGMQAATEPSVWPEQALALGPTQVLPRELRLLGGRAIDLAAEQLPDTQPGTQAWGLCLDLCGGKDDQTAWRAGRRFVRGIAPQPLAADLAEIVRFEAEGCHLITGGLGGIGMSLARALVRAGARRFLLTARQALPERDRWPELLGTAPPRLRARIEAVMVLEELGAEVRTRALDVCDAQRCAAVLSEATSWGGLRGVIHAAGLPNQHDSMVDTDVEELLAVVAPKVRGTRVLLDALQTRLAELDYLMFTGSMASSYGEIGQTAYAGANAVLAAQSSKLRAAGVPAICLDWASWRDVGMAMADELTASRVGDPEAFADWIAPEEGGEACLRCLAAGLPQVLICPQPIAAIEASRRRPASQQTEDATDTASYADEYQTAVAAIWQELLGETGIAPDADFYSLGGNSLMAAQVAVRIRKRCEVDVQVKDVLTHTRLADLAAYIASLRGTSDGRQEVAI